jgi:Tol biopolymer transport system component
MSPEQAAGRKVDHRSDQFALGSMLYEMATGVRAFHKNTSVETLTAILNEDPPAVGDRNPAVPVPLRWIIERCLEKDPDRRYASTRDLARDLETLRDRSSEAASVVMPAAPRRAGGIGVAALAAATLGLALLAGKLLMQAPPEPPTFRRLTFQRGTVTGARFAPDGQNVVYSAKWGEQPERIFFGRIGDPEALPVPLPDATRLLSVSAAGDLAVGLRASAFLRSDSSAILASVPLAGGTPREIRSSVASADFFPNGERLAFVVEGRLESPPGTVLYKDGFVGRARVSPQADRIAILEERDNELMISVVDMSGKRTKLAPAPTPEWAPAMSGAHHGLAWTPDGREILFEGGLPGATTSVLAVSVSAPGKVRTVLRAPGYLTVLDVAADGRMLLGMGEVRGEVLYRPRGGGSERDLAWFSKSTATDFSADGTAILMEENGEATRGGMYLRRTDGSPAFKIGQEWAEMLSPDAAWVFRFEDGNALLVPTGAGETRTLSRPDFVYEGVAGLPDGRRILVLGREEGHELRAYLQDAAGGALTPVSSEGVVDCCKVSPDGALFVNHQPDGRWIYPIGGGPRRPLLGVHDGETILCWSEDSRAVLTTAANHPPFPIYRVDVRDGHRELWKTIAPSSATGVCHAELLMNPDGASVMSVTRWINDLYLVEGAR